jgi:hypothetical protein
MRHTTRKIDKRSGKPLIVDDTELALMNIMDYAMRKLRERGVRLPPTMVSMFRQAHKEVRTGYVDLPTPPDPFSAASYLDDAEHLRVMHLVAEQALWLGTAAGDDAGAQEDCEELAERVENARTQIENTMLRLQKNADREAKLAARAAKKAAKSTTNRRSA